MRKARKSREEAALVPRVVPDFVPPLLSFVAGYIDAVTFVALFGLFVAQATGSFVVAGAQIVEQGEASVLIKVLAIPVFLLGAVAATLCCHWLAQRGHSVLGWSLTLECALLTAFYACAFESPLRSPNGTLTLAASLFALAAMGVQSALVRLLMRGVASTNVMTTNTSTLGIDAGELLIAWYRHRKHPWSRKATATFRKAHRSFYDLFRIMFGFLAGAAIGAAMFAAAGINSLAVPVTIVAALAAWAFATRRFRQT